MYHYAQRWSDRASAWLTEGDQYGEIKDAAIQVGKMRDQFPEAPEDHFRITSYLTPLSPENESTRLAR